MPQVRYTHVGIATGKHELFYYTQGYLRTLLREYTAEATDNYIHLTNNCLQKARRELRSARKRQHPKLPVVPGVPRQEFPQHHIDFYHTSFRE